MLLHRVFIITMKYNSKLIEFLLAISDRKCDLFECLSDLLDAV